MKMRFTVTLLLCLCVSLSMSKGITKQQLDERMKDFTSSPFVTLLLIYDSANPKMEMIETYMDQITQKRKGYFRTIFIDCNTDDQSVLSEFVYCSNEVRPSLPALVFSQPKLNWDPNSSDDNALASMKQFQGQLDERSLYNFAVPLMNLYSVELRTAKDLKKFRENNSKVPHIFYFTDKESAEKIPPFFRALTAHFRNTIAFAHIFSKIPLCAQFNVSKFPTFLLNGEQPIEVKSNLTEMVERLNAIKGDETTILIKQFAASKIAQLTADNLEESILKVPECSFVHVTDSEGNEHSAWSTVTEKFGRMCRVFETDTLRAELGVKQTPSIVFFPKSVAKKMVQRTVFSPKETFEDIHREVDSIVEDFSLPISNFLEMQRLTGIHLQDEKYVAVFFHTEEVPLSYKVIADDSRFKEDIAFFRMRDPEPQVLEQYQIKKLPALVVMIADKEAPQEAPTEKDKKEGRVNMALRLAAYRGKFNYDDLLSFFRTFSKKGFEESVDHSSVGSAIYEVKTAKQLKNKCSENCLVLLFDGTPTNAQRNSELSSILQKEASKLRSQNLVSIDGVCHSELLSTFDISTDELPTLLFVDTKFEKFARMVGRVEAKSVSNFLAKVHNKKVSFRGYDTLLFEDKDCAKEHERLRKLSNEGAAISDEEAAILEELRAEEAQRRQELGDSPKNRDEKIRKKNKKKRPKREWENEEEL